MLVDTKVRTMLDVYDTAVWMDAEHNTGINLEGVIYEPSLDLEASGGILEAKAKRDEKYIAQITLSAASPAAKTDGATPRASETAT